MPKSLLQKKQKTVSWSETVNSQSDKFRDYTPIKPSQAKETLSESDREFAEQTKIHLKHSLIDLLIFELSPFKKQGKLFKLTKYDNFRLFNWSLENYNLKLMMYLLNNLSPSQSYLTLRHNDYAAVKKLIAISKNSKWGNIADKIVPILEAILKIKPNDELLEAIQSELSEHSEQMNSDSIKNLQAYINSQTVSNGDCTSNASLILECKSSLVNKKHAIDPQASIDNAHQSQQHNSFRP